MPSLSDHELDALRNSVGELSMLNEIATAINLSMSVNKITQTILASCLRKSAADQGAVFLLADDVPRASMFRTFVRRQSESGVQTPFHLNESLIGWMIQHKSLLIMNDPDNDKRFSGIGFAKLGITSLLAAPLISRSSLIGVLALFNKRADGGFSKNDQRFLSIVGTQTATVIANAQLFEKEQELRAIQEEMRLARSIQENYLPHYDLTASEFDILGFSSPAKEVGGDYYDMLRLNKKRVFFSVGDVSGKGVPAALLAAQSLAVLRSQLQANPRIALPDLTGCLNRLFFEWTAPERFMTSFLAIYDVNKQRLRYINAGHPPPIVLTEGGSVQTLETSGLVIGVLSNSSYTLGEIVLHSGDTVFVYTDGVTDNFGPNDEEYGENRLKDFVSDKHGTDIGSVRDCLVTELAHFRQGAPQSDDITFVIMRVK